MESALRLVSHNTSWQQRNASECNAIENNFTRMRLRYQGKPNLVLTNSFQSQHPTSNSQVLSLESELASRISNIHFGMIDQLGLRADSRAQFSKCLIPLRLAGRNDARSSPSTSGSLSGGLGIINTIPLERSTETPRRQLFRIMHNCFSKESN